MLPTFTDPDLQASFATAGFVTIPLLSPAEIDELATLWRGIGARPGQAFLSTVLDENREDFVIIHEALRRICQNRLTDLFDDHLLIAGHVIDKRPVEPTSDAGTVPLHQDWSAVDESTARSAFVWCPLVDTIDQRAPLEVVPGSQWLSDAPRGSGSLRWLLEPLQDQLRARLIPVPVQAGTAIIYDGALVHASRPNHTQLDRPVVGIGMVPKSVPLLRYHGNDDGSVERFVVEPEYFLRATLDGRPTDWITSVSNVTWTWTTPSDGLP